MSLVLDLIFPKRCYGCGRSGNYLCLDCSSRLKTKPISPAKSTSALEYYLPLFAYRGPLKKIISDLKYGFVTDLIPQTTLLMSETLKKDYPNLLEYWHKNHYILTPIPLHWQRQNWRGFNQSRELTAALAARLQLDYCPDLIIKPRATVPQALLSSAHRYTNITGSFSLNPQPLSLLSSNIVLVDDVATTGATLLAAAAVLKNNSFTSICGLTLAGGH